jgi:hypothetical protein
MISPCHHCSAFDDIEKAKDVQALIADITDVRQHKIRAGLESIDAQTTSLKLNNICAMELNRIRPICIASLNRFQALAKASADAASANIAQQQQQPMSQSQASQQTPSSQQQQQQHYQSASQQSEAKGADAFTDHSARVRKLRRFQN